MTSTEFKNAYYALLKNGYSLPLRELYKSSYQFYKDTTNELEDITVNYMMFYLLYFALAVLPISAIIVIGILGIVKLNSQNTLLLSYAVCVAVTHIYTLYASLKAHIAFHPSDNWNGEFRSQSTIWLLSGIVPISILYGFLYSLLAFSCIKIGGLLPKIMEIPAFLGKDFIIAAACIYLLVSTRLALPIMLYGKTGIGEAIFLSMGVVTRKFFHFLLIEINYLIVLFLGAALILLGLIFSLEYIKSCRSFLVHYLVDNDEKIIEISAEMEELIEQIGDK